MPSSPIEKMHFKFVPEWRLTLFTAVLLPCMIAAGFWQLQRAEEKRDIVATLIQAQKQPPVNIEEFELINNSLAYRQITAVGEFVTDRKILIDNRLWSGKFGYHAVLPFILDNTQKMILVNRGWVAGDPARKSFPDIATPSGKQTIRGHIYVPPGEAYILGEQKIDHWPAVLQALDFELIASALKNELFPYSIRLEKDTVAALQVDWKVVNQQPEKHTAYALQWFCMSVALVLIYIWNSSNLGELLRRKSVN